MPSAIAQETLIRETYTRAGLDLAARADHPQYFEAHGTGTPAGDPIEAQAIHNALGTQPLHPGEEPLFVGSIKTVLGHTEGTAGVAAILKASLALRHANIPPNLWFERLSDRVAPFYKNVEVPQTQRPWPYVAGGKRRASVNSFGFGGANAHAILESFDAGQRQGPRTSPNLFFTPFVFSALSQRSLAAGLHAYLNLLDGKNGGHVDLHDLAWTLRQRRSVLGWRKAVTASSLDDLRTILRACDGESTESIANVGVKALPISHNRILGIFTGQGAQYARMGADLIQQSKKAREIIHQLESYLGELPDGDAPAWSLEAELLAETASRVHEASISQPLCTAVQILLVDLLRLGGVDFDAVVGHSSGEIGAAYDAGFLTARDAMCIAYYRGLHLQRAFSPNGKNIKGAMLAVGTSPEDADELCSDRVFKGRIVVAAYNSHSSVTISGDEDAIAELEMVLEDDKIFYRRLRVDSAYHSPHMLPCYDPYIASLRRCGVVPQTPGPNNATWFSSLYDGMLGSEMAGLGDMYWAENMTRPVLFSQAVGRAFASQPCDLVVEVGPHPALKGPVRQVIQHDLGREVPYHGTLTRESNAVEAMSSVLGFLWTLLEPSRIDMGNYEQIMNGESRHLRLVKGLPTYGWNHHIKYWHESRRSRKMRTRPKRVHPLLGDISSDSSPHHMSWRHVLSVGEIGWLSGHRVHGQVVFPAAGYVCTAIEASRFVAEAVYPERNVRLIEIHDFTIHQPVPFDDEVGGIEVFISMAEITPRLPNRASVKFTYSAALPSQHVEDLTLAASCYVEIVVGNADLFLLPTRKPVIPHMLDVEPDRFYAALADLGYGLSGPFQSLTGMYRKHCRSSSLVKMGLRDEGDMNLLIHPTELDAALQSIILAHSYPYDEELRIMHLPTAIRKIRINPALCNAASPQDQIAAVDAAVVEREMGQRGITGQVNLYSDSFKHAAIQVERASFMPLGGTAAGDDRKVFSKVHWIRSQPNGEDAARHIVLTQDHYDVVKVLERIAIFYLRKFDHHISLDHPARSKSPTNWYLKFAKHVTSIFESGNNPWAQSTWLGDTLQDVVEASKPFWHISDVQIMHLVGTQMPRVFDGETTMLEQFRADGNDILDKYYTGGFGVKEAGEWVGRSVKQIEPALVEEQRQFFVKLVKGFIPTPLLLDAKPSSYTDISAAFLEGAAETFPQHKDRMIFKTFDVERDPTEQGYAEGTFDLVVAFLILHATSDIDRCLSHIRRLLKPGGFLVVAEGLDAWDGFAKAGFIWGTLPGWWLRDDARCTLSPHLLPKEWVGILQSTGFSGVDTSLPTEFQQVLSMFCFVSQAVNNDVKVLRQPIVASSPRQPPIEKLVLVGGQTPRTSSLVEGLRSIFAADNLSSELYHFKTLLDVDYDVVDAQSTVISLAEVDKPIFKDMGPKAFMSLKAMFTTGKTLLWVTSGRMEDEPFSNMTVGFGNVAANETPDLCLQQLDIANPSGTNPKVLAEILLRFYRTVGKASTFLWTVEPQIVLDKEGQEVLPRLRPIPELNDRYNSAQRPVVREVNIEKLACPVTLQREPWSDDFIIRELPRHDAPAFGVQKTVSHIEFRIMYSTLSAVKTPLGYKFLALGIEPETKMKYLALIPSLKSVTRLPVKSVVHCLHLDLFDGQLVSTLSAHLVALHVLASLFTGQTFWAHNPSSIIARALAIQAAAKGVRVVFSTDSAGPEVPESWIRLPRYITQSDVEEIFSPINPSCFAGFTNEHPEKTESQTTLLEFLRGRCEISMTAGTIYSSTGSDNGAVSVSVIVDTLNQALEYSRRDLLVEKFYPPDAAHVTFTLGDVVRGAVRPEEPLALAVVDWTALKPLPVHVSRLDSMHILNENSSYWIVGMSRALGLSLADWMIRKGARTLVLTSRKPDIDPKWIAAHRKNGANVVILPCDVTDEPGLQTIHSKMCATLPPIKGVIHGAMVLRDTTISKMNFDQLTDVLRPKVNGSIHLDRIFQDTNLDFFVLMSSINRVFGNHGQANYAAANSFLWSIAAQRRKRGLRAATVDIGAIIGAGYLEREFRRELDAIVERYNMLRMSEEDWCQSICEAIDACRLESPNGPGLTTGLSEVPINVAKPPSWHTNPMFSAFVTSQGTIQEKQEVKEAVAIGEQLCACQSAEDVFQVIKGSFATKMRAVLQVIMTDEDLIASRSSDLGLDSLVAVDISTWFLKQLQVKVPVLKILGNNTMASLVQYAVENVPAELVPRLGFDGTTDEREVGSMSEHSSNAQTLQVSSEDGDVSVLTTTSKMIEFANGNRQQAPTSENIIIDWHAESQPPTDLADVPVISNLQHARSPPRVVILTGCTGLLGHHLLSYLLAQPTVQSVICLAVRALSSLTQKGKLPSTDPRVTYHAGDLTRPLLGLTEEEASAIFAEGDVAIHNGADTSHLKHYSDVRLANLGSTTALVRLCLPRQIPLHYVSSVGLGLWHENSRIAGFSPGPVKLAPGSEPDGSFGYLCSKWTCERLLERSSELYGLRVCIHRPSTIVREGEDALGQRADKDWVNAFLTYVRRLNAIPRAERNRGNLDLVYVGTVCEGIITRAFHGGDAGAHEGEVTYVHEVGDRRQPLGVLQDGIQIESDKMSYQVLPLEEWIAKAIAAGLHPGVAALIESMQEEEEDYPNFLTGDSLS
ncbi:Polyketide synthase-nonribosomal peptide synthetase [Lachnellula willkommii]|uniref:Polyketide synthase-nonribosomal peptide synthetase n=1 Tax=Lachnellula willkommii TaxID=215461 RepID=A0A559MNE0_9HELO|nr:Polyketide synthase-nonribosomal peptide synthetase [Lachnellula willkommii]